MKITHAMEAAFDGTALEVIRSEGGGTTLMFHGEGAEAQFKIITLTDTQVSLLAQALPDFVNHPERFEVQD